MQKRNGRSCGNIPLRLTKWSVCYYSPEPSTASGSFCFILFSLSQRGERESDSSTLAAVLSFFYIFVCSLLSLPTGLMPYAGIFLFFVLFLSVKQQSSSCFVRATTAVIFVLVSPTQQVSVPLQHVCCSS